jgi:hypothetical protein
MSTKWQQALRRRLTGASRLTDKYLHVVRKHGSSRAKAVAYITSIGGYSDRHSRYPLMWSAKAYRAKLDIATLYSHDAASDFSHLRDECGNDGERGVLYQLFYTAYQEHKDQLWDWGTEEAWETFKEDTSTFWGQDVSHTWHLLGRSGGNAVLAEFDGATMSGSPEELEETLMERPDKDTLGVAAEFNVDHIAVVDLFLYCVQIGVDWDNPDAVGKEVEFRAAWRLWAMISESELEEALATYRNEHPED